MQEKIADIMFGMFNEQIKLPGKNVPVEGYLINVKKSRSKNPAAQELFELLVKEQLAYLSPRKSEIKKEVQQWQRNINRKIKRKTGEKHITESGERLYRTKKIVQRIYEEDKNNPLKELNSALQKIQYDPKKEMFIWNNVDPLKAVLAMSKRSVPNQEVVNRVAAELSHEFFGTDLDDIKAEKGKPFSTEGTYDLSCAERYIMDRWPELMKAMHPDTYKEFEIKGVFCKLLLDELKENCRYCDFESIDDYFIFFQNVVINEIHHYLFNWFWIRVNDALLKTERDLSEKDIIRLKVIFEDLDYHAFAKHYIVNFMKKDLKQALEELFGEFTLAEISDFEANIDTDQYSYVEFEDWELLYSD